jgi:multidrug resistance efflux pump
MAAGTAKADVREIEKDLEQARKDLAKASTCIETLEAENEKLKNQIAAGHSLGEGQACCIAPLKRTTRHLSRRIDLHLPQSHAQKLRDLFDGLYEKEAKLKDGKPVNGTQRAMLWLLENLKEAEKPKT